MLIPNKHNGYSQDGRRTLHFGSNSSPTHTTSTVTQSNIPEWLRPQVETVLGGSMQELFNTQKNPDGTINITGTKPFQAFGQQGAGLGANEMQAAQSAVAGFQPLQREAQYAAAGMQTPGQFGQGSQLAGAAGLGGLGTANNALGYAQQSAGVGGMYENMATNPAAYQAYMSPYQQAVTDLQMQSARRQDDISRQQRNARATQSGAFGGSRQAIEEAEAQRALGTQLQNIQATGLQNAYQQAQQNMAQRAQFELQGLSGAQQGIGAAQAGYGLAGQAGSALGNLGAQQLTAQQGIIGLQNQLGAQQQAQQQAIINQAVQNYAQGREAPMQALSQFNALLRGYALPGQTTTQYQAAPALGSQLAGLGTAAYGLSGLSGSGSSSGKKAGGTIRSGDGIDKLALRKALAGA